MDLHLKLAAVLLAAALACGSATAQPGAIDGAVGEPPAEVMAPPPPELDDIIRRQDAAAVQIEENLEVGDAVPAEVDIRPVPGHDTFAFARVNGRDLIVDPRNRIVLRIVE